MLLLRSVAPCNKQLNLGRSFFERLIKYSYSTLEGFFKSVLANSLDFLSVFTSFDF